MPLYHADIIDIDLNSGTVHRSFAQKVIGEGDKNANRFGVRLWRNGEPVNIGGSTCMGFFIRHSHGNTITINGGLFNGQEAYVTLPESCYVYDGAFTLVIKLVGGNVTGTMRIVDGTIADSMIGSPIDPGGQIPDLTELLAVIGRAEAAADVIAGFDVHTELISGENYAVVINDGGAM